MLFISVTIFLIALYGLASWANRKDPERLKWVALFIFILAIITIVFEENVYDLCFSINLPLKMRLLGFVVPTAYIAYLKLQKSIQYRAELGNLCLMYATGFYFGFLISTIFFLIYFITMLIFRKKNYAYANIVFWEVLTYYVYVFILLVH